VLGKSPRELVFVEGAVVLGKVFGGQQQLGNEVAGLAGLGGPWPGGVFDLGRAGQADAV
jgi:hypothetical protein